MVLRGETCCRSERRSAVAIERRVHPRTRAGGGARWIRVMGCGGNAADHDEVDIGRGRSGAKRRGVLEMAMADGAESDGQAGL